MVLLLSLHRETGEQRYVDEAEWVVKEVDRVLGRPKGIRIGQDPDRDGQYFHYLAMWLFALARFAKVDDRYRQRGIALVRRSGDEYDEDAITHVMACSSWFPEELLATSPE